MDAFTAGNPSLRRLTAAFLALLQNHIELFGLELQEQKSNAVSLLLFSCLALLCILLFLIGLSALVLIIYWDTHRIEVASGLCVFYFIAAAFCGWRVYRTMHNEKSPFSATMAELANDREQLLQ